MDNHFNHRQATLKLSKHDKYVEDRDYHVKSSELEITLKLIKKHDRFSVDYEVTKDLDVIRVEEITIVVNDKNKLKDNKILTIYPSENDVEFGYRDNKLPEVNAEIGQLTNEENEINYIKLQKEMDFNGERMPYNSLYPYYNDKPVLDINVDDESKNEDETTNNKNT